MGKLAAVFDAVDSGSRCAYNEFGLPRRPDAVGEAEYMMGGPVV